MASATRATRVILPKAATKSLQAYSWCSLPLMIFQPGNLVRRACISALVNFFAGMGRSFETWAVGISIMTRAQCVGKIVPACARKGLVGQGTAKLKCRGFGDATRASRAHWTRVGR